MTRTKKKNQPQNWLQQHGILGGLGSAIVAGVITVTLSLTSKPPAVPGGITIMGYSIAQHEAKLTAEKRALTQNLEKLHRSETKNLQLEKQLLEKKTAVIESQLANLDDSYQKQIGFLQSTVEALRAAVGDIDNSQLAAAEATLMQGNTAKAEALFARIENKGQVHILRAAKAAFERGRIAGTGLDYQQAYRHFARAVGYAADNPEYLSFAGRLAGIVAKHQQEVDWKAQALAIYLASLGENSPKVAEQRNALGEAYHELGQYNKAIAYFQSALASDLTNHGEQHPAVARDHLSLIHI